MSHALIIRRRAEHDMAEAGLWYETRRPGTALYFIRCVDAAIALITRYPEAGPVQFGLFRRVLVSRFPFSVFYTIETETVIVHGVYHSSRDPDKIRQILESESDEPMAEQWRCREPLRAARVSRSAAPPQSLSFWSFAVAI